MKQLYFDVECYPNYFLVSLMDNDHKIHNIELLDGVLTHDDRLILDHVLRNCKLIGFNSQNYDRPMILLALYGSGSAGKRGGLDVAELKRASDLIIDRRLMFWQTLQIYNINPAKIEHIDIINVLRGLHGLKKYAANLGYETIEDLPYAPDQKLTLEQIDHVRSYCANDLKITKFLYNHVEDRVHLRSQIGKNEDFRSLSDAQIAEKIIRQRLNIQKPNPREEFTFNYRSPDFLEFQDPRLSEYLKELKTKTYPIDLVMGGVKTNPLIHKIKLQGSDYKIGVGGLHSCEKGRVVNADEQHAIIDIDVTSYYPNIIINNGFFPQHLGPRFLTVYKQLVSDRIKAKRDPDRQVFEKAFKIVINGLFGKFGSKYSAVYSPSLLLNVTLTGQLSLLMLIERLELAGVRVLSANTDGVTCYIRRSELDVFRSVYAEWEKITRFNLEECAYKVLCNLNVNSYFALTENGDVKTKGAVFSPYDESTTPSGKVIGDAVISYVKDKTPIYEYINNRLSAENIKDFLFVRSVTGGCEFKGSRLGKVARFYWSKSSNDALLYCKNGNKVPRSDNSRPLLDVNSLSDIGDLDVDRYVDAAIKTIRELGIEYA